jgi:hypothetical protein
MNDKPEREMSTQAEALAALRACRYQIAEARAEVNRAIGGLHGARRTRAVQLADKLADCQLFVERLAFFVEGDLRADDGPAGRPDRRGVQRGPPRRPRRPGRRARRRAGPQAAPGHTATHGGNWPGSLTSGGE